MKESYNKGLADLERDGKMAGKRYTGIHELLRCAWKWGCSARVFLTDRSPMVTRDPTPKPESKDTMDMGKVSPIARSLVAAPENIASIPERSL